MTVLRIASFNVENLDDKEDDYRNPPLQARAPVLRGYFQRLRADIVCLQEVHGQELPDHEPDRPSRDLRALREVLTGTPYETFHLEHTKTRDMPYDVRNLVVLSRYPVLSVAQYRNNRIKPLKYRKATANPAEEQAKDVDWERPILHVVTEVPQLGRLHVINLHLKSRLASDIEGQRRSRFSWRNSAAWAEGYFLSSIKRVGQALETRVLVDEIFAAEPGAALVVCGDFNAEPGEVPVEAIAGAVENTGNPELRPGVLVSAAEGVADSRRFSHLHHGHKNLLDHMMISQRLLPLLVGMEIHNENLHDESLPYAYDTKYPESDHAPVVVEMDLGKQE